MAVVEVYYSDNLKRLLQKAPQYIINSDHLIRTVIIFNLRHLRPQTAPKELPQPERDCSLDETDGEVNGENDIKSEVENNGGSVVEMGQNNQIRCGHAAYMILKRAMTKAGQKSYECDGWHNFRDTDGSLFNGTVELALSSLCPVSVQATSDNGKDTIEAQ